MKGWVINAASMSPFLVVATLIHDRVLGQALYAIVMCSVFHHWNLETQRINPMVTYLTDVFSQSVFIALLVDAPWAIRPLAIAYVAIAVAAYCDLLQYTWTLTAIVSITFMMAAGVALYQKYHMCVGKNTLQWGTLAIASFVAGNVSSALYPITWPTFHVFLGAATLSFMRDIGKINPNDCYNPNNTAQCCR